MLFEKITRQGPQEDQELLSSLSTLGPLKAWNQIAHQQDLGLLPAKDEL